jgi:hypothetical protein
MGTGPKGTALVSSVANAMKIIILFAACALSLFGADSRAVSLTARFGPEVLATAGSDSVSLRIRLSVGAAAQVWIADICSSTSAGARLIAQSGDYNLPISTLPGTGRSFCVSSLADGLFESVPLMAPVAASAMRCTGTDCFVM